MTLQEAVDKFIDFHVSQSVRSGVTYRSGLNHYVEWLGDRVDRVEDLTSKHFFEFFQWLASDYRTREGKRLAKSSLALYVAALIKFHKYLITLGLIDEDSFLKTQELIKQRVRGIPRPPIETKLPEPEMVAALLEAVDREPDNLEGTDAQRRRLAWLRDRAILYCLESSGVRVGELAGLTCGDLIHKDRGAYVTGKGDKQRFTRFSNAAWDRLMVYLKERGNTDAQAPLFARHDRGAGNKMIALSPLSMERTVTKLATETGVLETFNLTPHSFRHFFATRFLRHTGDLALTQDALGHANPATTRIYAKTTKEDLIRAHDAIFED